MRATVRLPVGNHAPTQSIARSFQLVRKAAGQAVSGRAFRWAGRVKTILGRLTGDRRVEAEGIVEADTGHHSAPEELRTAKHDVRADHGDLDETSTEGGSGHVEA